MDLSALKYVGVGLTAMTMAGAAIGVGMIFAAILNGVARNPATESKLVKWGIVGAALAELMGLLAFVIAMIVLSK
jgi:F-type H+-transporting ATPase subunit c